MATDIRRSLRKVLPFLIQAKTDNLNEADTVQRLLKVFENVLEWDLMTEVSREAQFKGKYVDIVLKIDGVVRMLVEAKAAGETLRERHIEQAQSYASRNNYRWVVLTNGTAWNLYHLTFENGIEYERAFSIDLADPNRFDDSAAKLALLHRQAVKKGEHEEFWQRSAALSPASIGRALFDQTVLGVIRREIRREEGLLIDPEDLASAIHKMLSQEARELVGPVKVRKRRAGKRSIAKEPASALMPDMTPDGEKALSGSSQESATAIPLEKTSPP